ncbi:MAG: hypothetical protein HY909_04920 [Deltaproteobacteria bacterium]|nr:hypothetical protein [Deltaproteobacteria bacterium]
MGCSGGGGSTPDATSDAAQDALAEAAPDSALDSSPDVSTAELPDATTTPDLAPPDVAPGDTASDGTQDVMLAFGCPILREPVDRPGSPAGSDTYDAFARGFFDAWCVRCHHSSRVTPEARMGAPDGFNWDQRPSVMTHLARIRSAVGVENYMPLTDPRPTCAERRRLVRWIDLGAP